MVLQKTGTRNCLQAWCSCAFSQVCLTYYILRIKHYYFGAYAQHNSSIQNLKHFKQMLDSHLKRWRANVENQSKKLKALREASLEKLRASTVRRSPSPAKDEQAETVKAFTVSQGMPRLENLQRETTPKVKKEEDVEAKGEEIEAEIQPLVSLEDYAKKILDVVEKNKQSSRGLKLKKIKGLLKKLTSGDKERIEELETTGIRHRQQLENAKQKCESTTKVIAELEGKLFASEKEKVELRIEKDSILDKFNTANKELSAYRNQYFLQWDKRREVAVEMLKESHKTINETNAMLRKEYEDLKKEYEEEAVIWQSELSALKRKFDLISEHRTKEDIVNYSPDPNQQRSQINLQCLVNNFSIQCFQCPAPFFSQPISASCDLTANIAGISKSRYVPSLLISTIEPTSKCTASIFPLYSAPRDLRQPSKKAFAESSKRPPRELQAMN
eukprot:TRINITY_DN1365_c0_g1_i1.p1 TRINITY_DN1365_c0_g1~~TRINITY_DN1365_c0_g1_i1.p1  ORF type:complete len:443 (+),score=29.42 TRINITY_DN1365_c0_g1_i1:3208-4536(+)